MYGTIQLLNGLDGLNDNLGIYNPQENRPFTFYSHGGDAPGPADRRMTFYRAGMVDGIVDQAHPGVTLFVGVLSGLAVGWVLFSPEPRKRRR